LIPDAAVQLRKGEERPFRSEAKFTGSKRSKSSNGSKRFERFEQLERFEHSLH
jgi:hypothetical protein